MYTLNVTATQELHKIILEQKDKTKILKYRCERYRTIHKKHLNIKVKVSTGTFTLYFD
jgi:hypothetical protein